MLWFLRLRQTVKVPRRRGLVFQLSVWRVGISTVGRQPFAETGAAGADVASPELLRRRPLEGLLRRMALLRA